MIIKNDDIYFVEILDQFGVFELEYVIDKRDGVERYNIWDNHRCYIIDQSRDFKKIKKEFERRKR